MDRVPVSGTVSYNEAQLRQDFLNPFLGALGWDMTNKAGSTLKKAV